MECGSGAGYLIGARSEGRSLPYSLGETEKEKLSTCWRQRQKRNESSPTNPVQGLSRNFTLLWTTYILWR